VVSLLGQRNEIRVINLRLCLRVNVQSGHDSSFLGPA
jgi:hypothetical protein